MTRKEDRINDIMERLRKIYTPQSPAYNIVKRGLWKLNVKELSCLYAMILSSK